MSKESQTSAALLQYDGKPSWYLPITQANRTQIADTILDYVGMYQDESIGMTGPGM